MSAWPSSRVNPSPLGGVENILVFFNVFLRGNGGNGKARVSILRRASGPSKTDRAGSPGYLVEYGVVVFYSPNEQDRVLGPVAPSPLSPSQLAQASL